MFKFPSDYKSGEASQILINTCTPYPRRVWLDGQMLISYQNIQKLNYDILIKSGFTILSQLVVGA